jgi:biotin transport system permease protein
MLTLNSRIDTPLHRWPAGVKLAGLCAVSVALFAAPASITGAALLLVAACYGAQGRDFATQGLAMLRPLWPFAVILILWHVATRDMVQGATILARLVTLVALANLVTMTTRLDDMLAVVERLATPLARVGLPPRTLALAIALAIRFTPVLMDKAENLRTAWRARSPRQPGPGIVLPMVLLALDDADHVAEALRARGGI